MANVKNYFSLIKFSHTIFALPFALIGFFIAVNEPDFTSSRTWLQSLPGKFVLVLLCMIFARSAAMAFNRWLDKEFDARNPRTAIREIPSGVIPAQQALLFVIINSLAFVLCCFLINPLCFYLSFVALLVILFYSYTKRFTALCHIILGVGLSLAPIGAYLAVTGKFSGLPLIFSLIVLCWVSGFDIIYSLQDEGFDREQNLHSIPAAVGKKKALVISSLLHLVAALAVIFAGYFGGFGVWYFCGAGIFISLLVYQHLIVKPHDLSRVNLAFMTTNGIASVIFAVFVMLDLFIN